MGGKRTERERGEEIWIWVGRVRKRGEREVEESGRNEAERVKARRREKLNMIIKYGGNYSSFCCSFVF